LVLSILYANNVVATSGIAWQWPFAQKHLSAIYLNIGSSAHDKQAKNAKTTPVSID